MCISNKLPHDVDAAGCTSESPLSITQTKEGQGLLPVLWVSKLEALLG